MWATEKEGGQSSSIRDKVLQPRELLPAGTPSSRELMYFIFFSHLDGIKVKKNLENVSLICHCALTWHTSNLRQRECVSPWGGREGAHVCFVCLSLFVCWVFCVCLIVFVCMFVSFSSLFHTLSTYLKESLCFLGDVLMKLPIAGCSIPFRVPARWNIIFITCPMK